MGFVVNLNGEKSHEIIRKGIEILINLTHRGACGCDPETGDGAGVLIQIPHEFFARECGELGFSLPEPGTYGVGMMFLPVEKHSRLICEGIVEKIAREEGLTVLGWRDTPLKVDAIGREARATQPYIEQVFLRGGAGWAQDHLEQKLYVVRRRAEAAVAALDIRSPRGRSYIKDCCWRRRSRNFTRTCAILRRAARCAWSTRDFRPTRSPPGLWRTPIATSATTGKSTPCGAT
jgi:glutamate synthase domain-containing protein 1